MTEEEKAPFRFNRTLLRSGQVAAMLITAFLLGAHLFKWESLRVDAVTLSLLGLLLVIPLVELVRKVKVGEFEAEIDKQEIAKAQAKAEVELPLASGTTESSSEGYILRLLKDDSRLALAKVRIDLEESLSRLFAAATDMAPGSRRISLGRMVDSLAKRGVLKGSIAGALRDVIGLANRAVHGEYVEDSAAKDLAILGVRLVSELQQLYFERILTPVEQAVIGQDEVERSSQARYKVTTIVPLLERPTRNTYILDQMGLDSFLEGYEEHAEFVVAVEPV